MTPIFFTRSWAPDIRIRMMRSSGSCRASGLNSVPGAEYQYNNGGYLLLGKILERASGQTSAPSPMRTSSSPSA